MNRSELRSKWSKEKESYKTQEVGSGTQRFVKDLLQSEEVFNLASGLKSTPREKRKNEFLEEEHTKARRRADIIIYIMPGIVIPVEVEKHQDIEAGRKQLLSYQADLDKKYGILTDGFHWRFYNNNIFREFELSLILDETDLFLEFWKEYIRPEFYYLSFFEKVGQLSLFEEDKLLVEENRQLFFEDITNLIRSFKNKLAVEGYFNKKELDETTNRKMAVEITYAYIIQFILYKTLVDNSFWNFAEQFEDTVEEIHQHIKAKRYKDILGIIDSISAQISKNIYRPFVEEQQFIQGKLMELYHSVQNELADVSSWLDIFVFIKKYDFANIENEIFGYIYENYLKELYEETKKGQYFTDPAVVNFMLQQIGFTPSEIKEKYGEDQSNISLIDPSCGSGTFLYSAVNAIIKSFGNYSKESSKQIEEIVNNNIFGLDIEEFPLYLAEMSILMRLLPMIITEKYNNPIDKKIKVFLTKDSIAEFLDIALQNTMHNIESGDKQPNLAFAELNLGYKSYVREETDLEEMKKSLEALPAIPRRRFDYVIGNPPYISYNECAKQKVLIFELIKQHRAKLSDIYGVNLHSTPKKSKKYPPKPNLYTFFMALGIALLKDEGKLCYIIPQTILTESDYDVMRYHMAKFTTIETIITFEGKMFIGRGLRQNKPIETSSLIFVLNRKMPSSSHRVKITNCQNPDSGIEENLQDILAGKRVIKKDILQKELLQNVANWSFIKHDREFLDFHNEYKRNSVDISIYYDHASAEREFESRFYFDVGFILDKKQITQTPIDNGLEIPDFSESKGYSKYEPSLYYPNDRAKITLPKASQGYVTLEQKYKIVWRKVYSKKFYFTDRNIVPSMSRSQIICSNNRSELLYLFSLLNAPVNKCIFQGLLQVANEQYGTFLVITRIKEFMRVPEITGSNRQIKEEIIKRIEEMLALEQRCMSDFVNFESVMLQKFDRVLAIGNNLILEKSGKQIKLPIQGEHELVRKIIGGSYYSEEIVPLGDRNIALTQLRNLPIIDFRKQQKIKDYIDDLVFALYFRISLIDLGISEAGVIKEKCSKNPYYKLVFSQQESSNSG